MKRIPLTHIVFAATLVLALLGGFLAARTLDARPATESSHPPFSLYDTRPCRTHPTPATCDARLPSAPWDAEVPAGAHGNGACLDGTLQVADREAVLAGKQSLGELRLMWAPSCQSSYAEVQINRATAAIGLRISQPESVPGEDATNHSHRTFSSLVDFGGGESEVNEAVSPLMFQQAQGGTITVLAIITFPDTTSMQARLDWSPPPSRHQQCTSLNQARTPPTGSTTTFTSMVSAYRSDRSHSTEQHSCQHTHLTRETSSRQDLGERHRTPTARRL